MKSFAFALMLTASFLFVACGGGNPTPPPPANYTIGGTVTGLSGTGLVLQDNGGNNLAVSANGSFTFTTAIANGGAYKVTVLSQPSGPAQTCAVTGGSGTASANVIRIQIACTTNSTANEWTWMSGSVFTNQAGTYGTLDMPAPGNVPGARLSAASWTDTSGSFWLFGGFGLFNASPALFNDLWKYSAGEWTWMGGQNTPSQRGTYGTQGTPAPSNVPGARYLTTSSTDAAGNFWLFGGSGVDSVGASGGSLNDLWEFSADEWTWVSGSDIQNQTGTYGTKGTPSSSNVPGARTNAVSWIDAAGNFWLFGGVFGVPQTYFNDLWKYSAGQWTWMSGSNLGDQSGTYGIQGTPAPNNVPGARAYAVRWTDAAGNFWLFGGFGYDSTGTLGD